MSNPRVGSSLRAGHVEGAIDQNGQYLFGVMWTERLHPLIERNSEHELVRVKVRINWGTDPAIANETALMSREDPLCQFFGLEYSQLTHLVHVVIHL